MSLEWCALCRISRGTRSWHREISFLAMCSCFTLPFFNWHLEICTPLREHSRSKPETHFLWFAKPSFPNIRSYYSLAPYRRIRAHEGLDVDLAAVLHPDCFDAPAVLKGLPVYLLQRARERDLVDLAVQEAQLSDVLNSVLYINIFQVPAAGERIRLYPLQG